MRTNWSYDSRGNKKTEVSLFHKTLIALLAMALMLAYLPTPNALAASTSAKEDSARIAQLEEEWRNKVQIVEVQNLFYEQVRVYRADFRKTSDLDRAWETLHQYGAWLRRANTIVATHEGFDWAGNVTNQRQAETSVRELAESLRAMRALMAKLDEHAVKFHRVRQGSQALR